MGFGAELCGRAGRMASSPAACVQRCSLTGCHLISWDVSGCLENPFPSITQPCAVGTGPTYFGREIASGLQAALHGSAGGLAHRPRKPARFCLSQEQSVVKRCSSLVLQCFWRASFFNQPNSISEQSGEFWCVYKSWSSG